MNDKLNMHTPNLADENFRKLAALFPNAVTETIDENGEVVRAIDKDVLMQEISARVVDGRELPVHLAGQEKGGHCGECAHFGHAAPGEGGQRGARRHARRLGQ